MVVVDERLVSRGGVESAAIEVWAAAGATIVVLPLTLLLLESRLCDEFVRCRCVGIVDWGAKVDEAICAAVSEIKGGKIFVVKLLFWIRRHIHNVMFTRSLTAASHS